MVFKELLCNYYSTQPHFANLYYNKTNHYITSNNFWDLCDKLADICGSMGVYYGDLRFSPPDSILVTCYGVFLELEIPPEYYKGED